VIRCPATAAEGRKFAFGRFCDILEAEWASAFAAMPIPHGTSADDCHARSSSNQIPAVLAIRMKNLDPIALKKGA